MHWRDAGFADGGRRRRRSGAGTVGGEASGPSPGLGGGRMISGRYRQRRLRIAISALLLLDGVDLFDAAENVAGRRRRHPVEVLLEVSASALAAASLEGEIVALLRPEVLVALPFGPGASASAGLQVGEHRQFPGLEALTVHVAAGGARFVVAGDSHRVPEIVQGDEHGVVVVGVHRLLLCAHTFPAGHATTRYAVFGIDTDEALNLAVLPARRHAGCVRGQCG